MTLLNQAAKLALDKLSEKLFKPTSVLYLEYEGSEDDFELDDLYYQDDENRPTTQIKAPVLDFVKPLIVLTFGPCWKTALGGYGNMTIDFGAGTIEWDHCTRVSSVNVHSFSGEFNVHTQKGTLDGNSHNQEGCPPQDVPESGGQPG